MPWVIKNSPELIRMTKRLGCLGELELLASFSYVVCIFKDILCTDICSAFIKVVHFKTFLSTVVPCSLDGIFMCIYDELIRAY